MYRASLARNADLALIFASTLVLVPLVAFAIDVAPLRIVLGLPFVLFFPGYVLVSALFPRSDDLDAVERVAFSFGASIAVTAISALVLSALPWGIGPGSVVLSLGAVNVAGAVAGAVRRERLPDDAAFTGSFLVSWLSERDSERSRWLPATIIVVTLGVVGVGGLLAGAVLSSETPFTEFYVLGPDGRVESYPRQATAGEALTLTMGVANQEGGVETYRIEVWASGERVYSSDQVTVGDGQTWERPVSFTINRPGDRQRLEMLLFKEPNDEPYRKLSLQLDIKPVDTVAGPTTVSQPTPSATATPVPAVTTTPEPTPSPAATATLTPAPTPTPARVTEGRLFIGEAGLMYTVQPGDTLSGIADRFGLTMEAVIAANGMPAPGPVLAGQMLTIPGGLYTVQPGDTLSGIAAAFGTSAGAIANANGIIDTSRIYWGETLIIPGVFR